MSSTPLIRMATPDDAEAAVAYLTALRAEDLPTIFRHRTVPSVEWEAEYLRGFASDPSSAWFAAFVDDALVGNLGIRAETHVQTRHVARLAMSILAPYRSAGLGTRMLETALAWADSTGLRRIELEVVANNPRAQTLYERFGFEVEGRRRGAILVDGEDLDMVQMSRLVSQPAAQRAPVGI